MDEPEVKPVSTGRRPRKQLRTPNPEVRERLLAAANKLIREQGFPALRVEEVAQEAGLSVGTFYLYFEGKDDLYTSLVAQHTAQLRELRKRAHEGGGTVLERMGRAMQLYLDFVEENERGFQYFRRAGSVQTTAGDLMSWVFDQHAQDHLPLFEEAVQGGLIRRVDLELLVQALLASTQHVVGYWLENRDRYSRRDIERFLGELSLAVVAGLAPRKE